MSETKTGALGHTGVGIKRADKYKQVVQDVAPPKEPSTAVAYNEVAQDVAPVVKKPTTTTGALAPTGVGAKRYTNGGGPVNHV